MRIGIDAQLVGERDSGVEVWIRNLIKALANVANGNDYFVYTQADRHSFDVGDNPRFHFVKSNIPHKARMFRILWEQTMLPDVLKRDRIDVFHAPGYIMPISCRIPTVVTVHDVIALRSPELCKRSNALHYGLLLGRTMRKARKIIASSRWTKKELIELFRVPEEKIEVVYPGVDESFAPVDDDVLRREAGERYALPERFILFVGNIEPKKNIRTLVEALSILKRERRLEHKLVIAGKKGWKYRPVFEKLHETGMRGEVHFCDYVSKEHLPAVYSMAEVFVFPSLYEGFGMPPLEAMASGTPVVTSKSTSLPEVVGDAALMAEPEDSQSLAKMIYKVLTNTFLRRYLTEKGKQRAKQFRWRDTARKVLEIYEIIR